MARKAVEQVADDPHQIKTLGVALYRNDRYNEAVAALEQSLQASKDEVVAIDLFFLAMCRHQLGDDEGAKKTGTAPSHGFGKMARRCPPFALRSWPRSKWKPTRSWPTRIEGG